MDRAGVLGLALPLALASALAWALPMAQAAAEAGVEASDTLPADAQRGRAIVADRRIGQCLLCHSGPFPERHLQGTLAPDLAGAGSRWDAAALRQRLVDPRRFNPDSLMPSYADAGPGVRVARAWQGRPLLSPQQLDDVVAFLASLR